MKIFSVKRFFWRRRQKMKILTNSWEKFSRNIIGNISKGKVLLLWFFFLRVSSLESSIRTDDNRSYLRWSTWNLYNCKCNFKCNEKKNNLRIINQVHIIIRCFFYFSYFFSLFYASRWIFFSLSDSNTPLDQGMSQPQIN